MKNTLLIVVAVVILAGVVASQLLPKNIPHAAWVQQPAGQSGTSLVLSLAGDSEGRNVQGRAATTATPPSLEIRCGSQEPEVRVYVPIDVRPAVGGPDAGPPMLGLEETFFDAERKTLPELEQMYSNTWTVDNSGAYAVKTDGKDFLERIQDKDWLSLGTLAVGKGGVSGLSLKFPIMKFGDYRAQVVSACGLGGT